MIVQRIVEEKVVEKVVEKIVEVTSTKLIEHFKEACLCGINPIELAFIKGDLECARELFEMREKDLREGCCTFAHPGYHFLRCWDRTHLPVWCKPGTIKIYNDWGCLAYKPVNRIDLEAVLLLMEYDHERIWENELANWLQCAYIACDLKTIARLYPFRLKISKCNRAAFARACNAIHLPAEGCLIDPFLNDLPIDTENREEYLDSPICKGLPRKWEYRPEDNQKTREVKRVIQEMVWKCDLEGTLDKAPCNL